MSEEVLDWKDGVARVLNQRDLYTRLLGKFIENEKDTPARVATALKNGQAEVHSTKGAAANLGAKALAAAALELEMTIKAGADPQRVLNHFEVVAMDTLVTMHAFITQ